MAILGREDYLNRVRNRFGETPNDDDLSFIEDMVDTYNDLDTRRAGTDSTEWERRYNELDSQWRKRYTDRFFTPVPDSATGEQAFLYDKSNDDVTVEDVGEAVPSIDDLFQ